METGEHDLPLAGSVGKLRERTGGIRCLDRGVDGNDMYQSADVLYFRATGTNSYPIIKKNMEFVINLTTKDMAYATDWCGVRSGREYNKFEEMKLTPVPGKVVKAPIIEESPVSIECRVKEIVPLGSHHMFIADVVNVQADDRYLSGETGKFELADAEPLVYLHGGYFELGKKIGKFGWSVEKKKKRRQ